MANMMKVKKKRKSQKNTSLGLLNVKKVKHDEKLVEKKENEERKKSVSCVFLIPTSGLCSVSVAHFCQKKSG